MLFNVINESGKNDSKNSEPKKITLGDIRDYALGYRHHNIKVFAFGYMHKAIYGNTESQKEEEAVEEDRRGNNNKGETDNA